MGEDSNLDLVVKVAKIEENTKQNTYQISELKDNVKEINQQYTAIYEISSAVKLMAQAMNSVKDDIVDIKKTTEKMQEDAKKDRDLIEERLKEEREVTESKVDCLSSKIDIVNNKSIIRVDVIEWVTKKENLLKLITVVSLLVTLATNYKDIYNAILKILF